MADSLSEASLSKAFPRRAGVLLHPTSLPGPYGIGDVGTGARELVRWLAAAGARLWQVLPLVPPGAGDSPYSSQSALSANPLLIDLNDLVSAGLLGADEIGFQGPAKARVSYEAARAGKLPLLEMAGRRLLARDDDELAAFRAQNPWVEDAALFNALREARERRPWWEWEPALRDRDASALARARAELREPIAVYVALQSLFERQWRRLRAFAHEQGIALMGDVPIYVAADSVDVWANREQFQLAANGQPEAVSGVPPDYFNELGQLWGNPLYDWARMARDGHAWWVQRLRRVLAQTDLVRLDHFRGFESYWRVPAGAPDAREGSWEPGPGLRLFEDLRRALGPLPVVAEDLGDITEEVHELRRGAGLPGMAVLQFAWGEDAENPFLPHNHEVNQVVYTGTHDNDTTRGWWAQSSELLRHHVRCYFAVSGQDVAWDFIRAAVASVAHTAIVPVQDVLEQGSEARMNVPGQADGNWGYRLEAGALTSERAQRFRELCALYGRLPPRPKKKAVKA